MWEREGEGQGEWTEEEQCQHRIFLEVTLHNGVVAEDLGD